MAKFRALALLALLLGFIVVGMGAYTRLTEAGLGCPDWPGCYGFNLVPQTAAEIAIAEAKFPDTPLEVGKAWNEMVHRYLAAGLGLLIAVLWFQALYFRRQRWLCTGLSALVVMQALLGMWTVTLNLMPLVVMAHLLGGFFILVLLLLLNLNLATWITAALYDQRALKPYLIMVGLVVLAQIALGGWTSSNYAAVVCSSLPICEGDWLNQINFAKGFSMPSAESYQYGVLDYSARLTIHVSHRLWAGVTALCVLGIALYCWKFSRDLTSRRLAQSLLVILLVQVGLGVSNVWFHLPIAVAVAHNLVAAILLLALTCLAYRIWQPPSSQGAR
ncbi:COX15/CtaA family protein [Motilimonas pumila]|uniref:Heme A synthase n=1 Tax=Motilimonas pumila TaxID=2303987 RepID=A0A418YHG6_9GAMM|nr:COX15/CtaA family protein [Motilimonas pumila]RJG49494.1 heme A synthase [Motilimonas pumila]